MYIRSDTKYSYEALVVIIAYVAFILVLAFWYSIDNQCRFAKLKVKRMISSL